MLPLPNYCSNSSSVAHNFTLFFLPITFLIETPIAWFGVYCILKLTPKHLLQAKILLLAHEFWVTFYSAVICIGLVPVAFFPYIGFYSQGIFDKFEVNLEYIVYAIGTGFGGMFFSILCLFAYRHQSVLPQTHALKLKPGHFTLLAIFIHGATLLIMIPFSLYHPHQYHEVSLLSLQTAYSTPPCDLWHPRLLIYWFGFREILIGYTGFFAGCSGLMAFYVAHSYRIIKVYQRITSKGTRKRQIGFLYALTLMASIPNVCLLFPTIAFVVCKNNSADDYHEGLSDAIVCVVGLHGLLSTGTMIFSHKPYRKEAQGVIQRIICMKTNEKKVWPGDVTKTAKFY